jgi:hypothetical protein
MAQKIVVHPVCPGKQSTSLPPLKKPKPITVLDWVRSGFRFPGKVRP